VHKLTALLLAIDEEYEGRSWERLLARTVPIEVQRATEVIRARAAELKTYSRKM
jgi:hypothetical protein